MWMNNAHRCTLKDSNPSLQRSHRFKVLCSFGVYRPGTLVTYKLLLPYCTDC